MKQFFISALAFFITFNTLSAQQNHLKPNQLVLESKKIHKTIPVQLFNLSNTRNKVEIPEQIKNYSILDLNQQGLRQLMHDRSPLISLNLPQQGRNDITLELVEVKPFAEDFTVKTAPEMKTIEVNIGKHYRGIIKGQERSIVAISIFDDQIMGLISHPSATGNMVVGKLENSENYILYQDDQIADQFNFDCKSKDHEIEYTSDQLNETTTGTRALTDCIRLYLEVDYDIYVNKGSSTTAVTNFVTGIFNQVITLYSNEQINTVVSEIVIWTQQSPYNSTSSINMLNAFTGYRQGFNGDLAQLLSYKASGGVAYVDGLCRSNPDYSMSYAGIQSTYQNVPAYSWSVEVCTHEFGHLFGSQHTHACVWNGNNTAIDGCYTPEGGCANPGIPSSSVGGTIMSYCHLTGAGINFSNGFGPQPGNVIRSRVSSVTCLQACSGGNPGGGTQCTSNTLTLELRTDNYPGETTWNIKSSTGVILYSGGPYSTANTLNTISLCLPTACYTFNINDTYGDGICCSYGSGYYNIKQGTTTLITGGQFGAAESKSFCATGTTAALTLSASTGSVAASAGSTSVGVTANVSWTAVSNATSWCTVTPASGSNNGTLNVAYTANTTSTSRSAIITVAGGGLTQSYTLTQSGNTPTLTLSAATGSAAAAAGSATVGVTANISWTAVSNATSWCTVTPANGANNGTINVVYTANTTTTSRSATITVSGSGLTRTYVLTQTGNTPTLTLSAATGNVAPTAGTTSVGVTANLSWTAASNASSRCTVTPASGSNNGSFTISYTNNTTSTIRIATITVTGSGLTRTYVLTQSGSSSGTTLSGHYFENGWDGWVDGGSDCFRYAGSLSPEGNYSIRLRDNSAEQSAMSSPNYNLTAYNTVQVEFKFRSNSMETGEDFRLLYFNGSTWSIVGTFVSGTNFYNNQLYTTTVTLTGSFSSASKFRFQNDANENDDEVYIDAVIIRASTGSASFENPIVIVAEGNEIYKLRDDSMVEIFPNPASDIIFTKSDEDIRQIKVYNISGQLMLNVTSDKIESVDTSNLINGLYIMSIETEENVYTEKFIKN